MDSSKRQITAWTFYDWANSAFATTVMAGFFPVFFKKYWSAGSDVTASTLQLGVANSIAGLTVAVIAPFLGAVADRAAGRKRLLLAFAVMGIVLTACLSLIARGEWRLAVACYVLASVGFAGANVFYDSLLVDVATPGDEDRISARGFATGYLGGGILFGLNVLMTQKPALFGITDATIAVRISFVTVALWWAAFSIPLLLYVKERSQGAAVPMLHAVRAGFTQFRATFSDLRRFKPVMGFLVAYWLYIDGVGTVIQMAVDYGMSLGFDDKSLIVALLVTQFIGFPAALVFGKLGQRIGARRAILIGIGVYIVVTIGASRMSAVSHFYALAVIIGMVQGGVQALSRSLYATMIPREYAAEFFGFYNVIGKFAAVVGPSLMGWVAYLTGSSRLSMLAITVLFVAGGAVLLRVPKAPS